MTDQNPPTRKGCLTGELLDDFLLGRLPESDFIAYSDHIENCLHCQKMLSAAASVSDEFVDNLCRPAPEDSHADEEECASATVRARDLGSTISTESPRPFDSDAEEPLPVERLGIYQIEEKLGTGGMGAVYRAWHTKLHRTVAIKVLRSSRLSDPDAVSRFEREMKAIGGLDHPNVVRATDADEDHGTHYLVMEHVEGIDLSLLQKRIGQLPAPAACELIRQAAVGLQYIHENGLVHRDIKPSNLMLANPTRYGEVPTVKILDLGLAMLNRNEIGGELTSSGQIMGTVDYMAPEQVASTRDVDIRADIYSLGATLYRLLTGQVPYPDDSYGNALDKIAAKARDEPQSVSVTRPDLDAPLVRVIARTLHRDPDRRYQTPSDVAEALEGCCTNADLAGLIARVESGQADRTAIESSQTTTRHPATSGGRLRIVLACVFAILLACVLAVAFQHGQDRESDPLIANVSPDTSGTKAVTSNPSASAASDEPETESGDFALAFAGRDQRVELPFKWDPNDPVTFEAWIRPNDRQPDGGGGTIFRCGPDVTLKLRSNVLSWHLAGGAATVDCGERNDIFDRRIHVAATWDGQRARIFLDGEQMASQPFVRDDDPVPVTVNVGGTADGWGVFQGTIDEARVSSTARYDRDFKPQEHFEDDSITLALYHFDEGRAEELKDSSGNGHHGKIIGAEWVNVDGSPIDFAPQFGSE